MNRTCHSINEGSFKISSTARLNLFNLFRTSLDELNEQREKLKEDKENFIKLDQERRNIETEVNNRWNNRRCPWN